MELSELKAKVLEIFEITEVKDLSFIEKFVLNQVLNRVKGTDIEILLKNSGLIK